MPSFIIVAYVWQILKRMGLLPLPPALHPWAAPKKPILNRVKKRLQHRCFLVNIAKFLRKAFFIEHPQWLLLTFTTAFRNYYWQDLSVIFFTLTYTSKRLREAVVYRCFCKKVFLKIFANFTRSTCVGVSF